MIYVAIVLVLEISTKPWLVWASGMMEKIDERRVSQWSSGMQMAEVYVNLRKIFCPVPGEGREDENFSEFNHMTVCRQRGFRTTKNIYLSQNFLFPRDVFY